MVLWKGIQSDIIDLVSNLILFIELRNFTWQKKHPNAWSANRPTRKFPCSPSIIRARNTIYARSIFRFSSTSPTCWLVNYPVLKTCIQTNIRISVFVRSGGEKLSPQAYCRDIDLASLLVMYNYYALRHNASTLIGFNIYGTHF